MLPPTFNTLYNSENSSTCCFLKVSASAWGSSYAFPIQYGGDVIIKSTAKNPKNRYADAREMYEDLKTVLDESRENEERHEYQFPELDSDGKKFTKQIENAAKFDEDEEESSEPTPSE